MSSRTRVKNGLLLALALGLATGIAHAQTPAPGSCPQPRFTGKAPDEYYNRANPLPASPENLAAGEGVYQGVRGRISCASCHGVQGAGDGRLAYQFEPPPRNFACAETIRGVTDGQLFWIIRYGSPGASMPPHKRLTDDQIWQTVHYVRQLAQ